MKLIKEMLETIALQITEDENSFKSDAPTEFTYNSIFSTKRRGVRNRHTHTPTLKNKKLNSGPKSPAVLFIITKKQKDTLKRQREDIAVDCL